MRLRVVGYQVQVRLRTLLPCFHKAHIKNLALMVVGMVFAQSFSLPAVLTGFKTCCGKLARSFTFFRRAGAGSPKGHRATRLHQVSSGTAQDATPRRVAGERDNVSDAVCAEEDDVPADTESRRRVSKCWSRLCKLRVGAVGHAAELAVAANPLPALSFLVLSGAEESSHEKDCQGQSLACVSAGVGSRRRGNLGQVDGVDYHFRSREQNRGSEGARSFRGFVL